MNHKLSFAVWAGLAAFVLPLLFFTETLILFSSEISRHQTLLMPVYWLLYCSVPIFICAILLCFFHQSAATLFLAIAITFSLVYLKLEFIPAYVDAHNGIKISLAGVLFISIYLLFLGKAI